MLTVLQGGKRDRVAQEAAGGGTFSLEEDPELDSPSVSFEDAAAGPIAPIEPNAVSVIPLEEASEQWVQSQVAKIKALWSSLPQGVNAADGYSTLQELICLKTITPFRRNELARSFYSWAFWGVIIGLGFFAIIFGVMILLNGGMNETAIAMSLALSPGCLLLGSIVIWGFEGLSGFSSQRLRYHIQKYLTSAEEQISDIKANATNIITAEGKRARSEGVPLDPVTNDNETRDKVKASIKSLVQASISLDRFPRALKEEWDSAVDEAMTHWNFAANERKRILPIIFDNLLLYALAAALVVFIVVTKPEFSWSALLGTTPPDSGQTTLNAGQSAASTSADRIARFALLGICAGPTVIFLVIFNSIARKRLREKIRTPLPVLMLAVPVLLLASAGGVVFLAALDAAIVFTAAYLLFLAVTYRNALEFSDRARAMYREVASSLLIKIAITLRVHRKQELLDKYTACGIVADVDDLLRKLTYSPEGPAQTTARAREWEDWLNLPEDERNLGRGAYVGLQYNLKLLVAADRPANKIADHVPHSGKTG